MSDDITSPNADLESEESKQLELLRLANSNPHLKSALIKSLIGDDQAFRKGIIKTLGGNQFNHDVYYNEESALKVKHIIDQMLEDPGSEFELLYADYPRYKPNTIRQKLYSGLSFLKEKMDTPDKKYTLFYNTYELQKIKNRGQEIGLRFINVKSNPARSLNFMVHKVKPEPVVTTVISESNDWKALVVDFIESEEQSIKLTELTLKQDDLDWLRSLFTEPGVFVVSATSRYINIRREVNWPQGMERIIIE